MRCRAGALRGPRPLRGESTGFALSLPMVGVEIFSIATIGSLDPKGITNHEVIATRAGCPAGRPCFFSPKKLVKLQKRETPLQTAIIAWRSSLLESGKLEPEISFEEFSYKPFGRTNLKEQPSRKSLKK
jgi:hypothetical protein